MEISIIIRTYNEEQDIGNCLTKIFNQNYKDFEVIIVDSGSQDRTLEIAKKFPVKIIKINKENFTFGKSLNLGCSKAKGEYIVSLSAHAIPLNDSWLKNLIKPLEDKRIAGVYGKEIPKKACNPMEARRILGTFKSKAKLQKEDCFFTNSNSAFKKQLWKKQKFNEKITTTEDHLWAKQMIKRGYLIYYEPCAEVLHSHNYSLSQLYSRYKKEIFNKYKKIENKNNSFILYMGIKEVLYSIIADWKFILDKKQFSCIFLVPIYNLVILFSLFSAVLNNP